MIYFATRPVAKKLASMFQLRPPDAYSQEWEMEVSVNSLAKLSALLDKFGGTDLTREEQQSMMFIMLNSMEEIAAEGPLSWRVSWERILTHLRKDLSMYTPLINYWKALDHAPENRFALSQELINAFPDLPPDPDDGD